LPLPAISPSRPGSNSSARPGSSPASQPGSSPASRPGTPGEIRRLVRPSSHASLHFLAPEPGSSPPSASLQRLSPDPPSLGFGSGLVAKSISEPWSTHFAPAKEVPDDVKLDEVLEDLREKVEQDENEPLEVINGNGQEPPFAVFVREAPKAVEAVPDGKHDGISQGLAKQLDFNAIGPGKEDDPFLGFVQQQEFDGGESTDEEPPAPLNPAASIACTRGTGGVKALLVSDSMLSQKFAQSARLLETLSSPAAVSGTTMKWVRGDIIGRGSLGSVFQALDQASGHIFAVKEVLINTSDDHDMKFKAALENEIKICSALKHPSIVTYLGHDTIDTYLYIYLEYMIGGSMASVLSQFGAFEESLIATYTTNLLEGLDYLHSQEPPVLHRDIKSANILMGTDSTGMELCAKLSDFGCSKRDSETLSHTVKGSILWMAPEVIKSIGYGRKADVWSFGCVIIEMGSASPPWGKLDNHMAAMYKIGMTEETPSLPSQLSAAARDFATCCLQRDPEKRPTAKELLQHDLVKSDAGSA